MTVPTAEANKRQITIHISTRHMGGCQVQAEFCDARVYQSPNAAPVFARMKWINDRTQWLGDIVLQTFATDEAEALSELLSVIMQTGVPLEAEEYAAAHAIAAKIAAGQGNPLKAPPRRARTKWRDENGKRVNVYTDTKQRFAHLPARSAADDTTPDQS